MSVLEHLYQGRCHCGAISFEFRSAEITSAMQCNCSICRRRGALLSNFVIAPDVLTVEAEENLQGAYKFGTQTATHYFCKRCGVFTHVETRLNPGHYRVNLGCIDALPLHELNVEVFEGSRI